MGGTFKGAMASDAADADGRLARVGDGFTRILYIHTVTMTTLRVGVDGAPAKLHVPRTIGRRLAPRGCYANAFCSAAAHNATAVFDSSITRPIVMKPWIWRSKHTYCVGTPACDNRSAY